MSTENIIEDREVKIEGDVNLELDAIIPAQPEETYHQDPDALKVVIPRDRRMMIDAPGWLNLAKDGGGYPGCRVVSITTASTVDGKKSLILDGFEPDDAKLFIEQLAEESKEYKSITPFDAVNLYYKHRANMLTVAILPTTAGVVLVHTNNLEGERLEFFREHSRRIAAEMDKWDRDRQERLAEEMLEQEKQQKEAARLIELGKKAEAENVFEVKNRLSKKMKRAKAELFKLGGSEVVKKLEDDDAGE
jgi:hypothetical protein